MKILEKINSLSTSQIISIIIFVGFIAFSNIFGNSFVWDDEEMVVKNFPIFQTTNIPQFFKQATFFSGGSGLSGWFYRPLVMISFLLTGVIFGQSPFGFHLVQLVLHLAGASILFLVLRELFQLKVKKEATPLALLLSLIFVVHPAHVEAVSYISSIAEPLYTLLFLVAFLVIIKSRSKKLTSKQFYIVIASFLLSLLTKEGAVIFLPIVAVYLFFFDKKALLKKITPFVVGLGGYLLIRLTFFGIQTQRPDFLSPISNVSFYERLLTVPFVFSRFLMTFFFPKILSVSQHRVVMNINDPYFIAPLILSLAFVLVVAFYLIKKRSKMATFFAIWFVFAVSPVLNLILPLDMSFAERWLYIPMIGLLGLLGVLAIETKFLRRNINTLLTIGFLAVLVLTIRTLYRNMDWKDGYTLYSHDIEIESESFDLQNNLGVEMFRKGEYEDAFLRFEKSVELQPRWTISLNNLAATYENKGDDNMAYEYYSKSVETGNYYLAYENLAALTLKLYGSEKAVEFLDEALVKFPNNMKLNHIAAISYYELGERALALIHAQKAYELYSSSQNLNIYQAIRDGKDIGF